MNNINSQDITPDESISQIDDVGLTWNEVPAGDTAFATSSHAITTISSNLISKTGISLPSESHYMVMTKDEVIIARSRNILSVSYLKAFVNYRKNNRSIGLLSEILKILRFQRCGSTIMKQLISKTLAQLLFVNIATKSTTILDSRQTQALTSSINIGDRNTIFPGIIIRSSWVPWISMYDPLKLKKKRTWLSQSENLRSF